MRLMVIRQPLNGAIKPVGRTVVLVQVFQKCTKPLLKAAGIGWVQIQNPIIQRKG